MRPLQLIQNAAAQVLTKTEAAPAQAQASYASNNWFQNTVIDLQGSEWFRAKTHHWYASLLRAIQSSYCTSSGTGLLAVPRLRTKYAEADFQFSSEHLRSVILNGGFSVCHCLSRGHLKMLHFYAFALLICLNCKVFLLFYFLIYLLYSSLCKLRFFCLYHMIMFYIKNF